MANTVADKLMNLMNGLIGLLAGVQLDRGDRTLAWRGFRRRRFFGVFTITGFFRRAGRFFESRNRRSATAVSSTRQGHGTEFLRFVPEFAVLRE